ncbi:MAG TPA: M18 family aminopeptidase [Acidimicrobiales bacterium]|jgi:aspartyl aminopeptidase|nr:M18 family aminopeptidase [Acidimicrobiales bacterium]
MPDASRAIPRDRALTEDLLRFIDAAPSPFHAVAAVAARLEEADFRELQLQDPWPRDADGYFTRRGGTLVAWRATGGPVRGFRIVGAHTDSPNLRLKPRPDHRSAGYRQLGVEVYGGVLLNSWLDRDLGLSGRVAVAGADGAVCEHLFRIDDPILRIPQLAIHLDREVNERGLVLNRQSHLTPLWGVGDDDGRGVRTLLAAAAGVDATAILAWDAMCHDLAGSTFAGVDGDLVSAPRIDNLLSCHAATTALSAVPEPGAHTPVVALFDHEEVGSTTDRGAAGTFLAGVLERIALQSGGARDDYLQAVAASHGVSADCAHATNPNYPERHEPDHLVMLNGGPVVKVNASARYATDAASAAPWLAACAAAGVPVQWFVTRSDLACGSTIGPFTAAQLAMPTVDVGVAQLAMHSCRELTGAADPPRFVAALSAYLAG